jgi:type II secretion system protein H
MKNRGFTLIEMVVVLVLISLSIALVTPSLSRFSRGVEMKATAQKVSGILRYFRSESIQKGRVYQILFDPGTGEIRIRTMEKEEREGEVKSEEQKRAEAILAQERRYPLPAGILIKEVRIPPPEFPSDLPTIEFYPTGGSNGGAVLLEMLDQRGYWIKVHFLTGIVEIEGA